ncbi:unnamed protein product [Arabidopsis lyrata]|uniref:F-box protein At1g30790 n=1 Tax=Arabidopsis lyrata subsp. lyrata TaxID=81972 RepID=UPI000A29B1C1|nr:F-box protein At1g30790 [Arabidopsis lyrata subsp. lyrata]CAH8271907.1 unnamed protein product [Arabidopsis lyrata]|eukprot:XP_020878934.1 F-box protein At1g30790 [Arabidopsis lyrata subsp. lyrata]
MEDSQPSPSSNLDDAGNSTTNIPLDLTIEILARLPGNSIIRFQYVSKLWFSIIRSKDFTDSFLTRSKTRPRLLFTFKHFDSRKRFIFSAPEHQHNDKSSTVFARHDMTISNLVYYIRSRPVNGFVCCTRGSSIAVCNPTTGQIVQLPDVVSNGRDVHARLGYDPVEDQYKVLCVMMFDGYGRGGNKDIEQEHFVITLRSQQKEWRKIEVTGDSYTDVQGGICIDGAIYYGGVGHKMLARFDVRSEKVEFIKTQKDDIVNVYRWTFINHQGKLGGIECDYFYEMRLWMQEREEYWNCMTCDVPCEWRDLFRDKRRLSSPGEIHTGEVMLVSDRLESSKPFSVFYYDPIKDSFRSAEVEGIADHEFRRIHGIGKRAREMLCFPGHIENIMFL